jgi:hypothetical protein
MVQSPRSTDVVRAKEHSHESVSVQLGVRHLVGGHVGRTGTRADVATQLAFMEDLKAAAQTALKRTTPGEGLNPADRGNPWAVFDYFIDRVVVDCMNQMIPKWSTKLAAFDVYIWDQCSSMEQSLRID